MPAFKFSRILVFLCMLILLSTKVSSNLLSYECPNTSTYTPNSSYQANLNLLLSALSSNATRDNGFYNFTAGRDDPPNISYGLFLCRGDVTTDVCQDCVVNASRAVVQQCPIQKVAIIWYDECMLRYSDEPIFSIVNQTIRVAKYSSQNISDPDRFTEVLADTMDDLATATANGELGKKFATVQVNFTALQKLYALAQCTPDLSGAGCNTCLRDAISNLPSCCDGRQGARVLFPSCNIRYELFPFYRIVAPPPSPTPSSTEGKGGISSGIITAIVVPVVVAVVLFFIGFYFLTRKARKKYDAMKEETAGADMTIVQSLQYDLETLRVATNNFSDDNKIGEGGFGDVYKGTIPNGQEIAVKRLSRSSGQGAEEFKNEVVLVAKLQHRNLVRLLGFCLERQEKILVYEFVPNKSLNYFLFDPEKQGQLDWSRRYKIIGGIARGILYLHEDSRLRIIHRDLKASNILLDGDMNPKVSDFGMARIFGVDQTQGKTSRVVGTYGYMSPEYAMRGKFFVKSDVFSFGVLVLEIISGKKNSSFYESGCAEDLPTYAWKLWRERTPLALMDPTLTDSYSRNEVFRCIHMGLLCVQEDVDARPSMATVVLMLNSYSVTLPLPQQPPYFIRSRTESDIPKGLESNQSTSKSVPWSVNEASITELYPR